MSPSSNKLGEGACTEKGRLVTESVRYLRLNLTATGAECTVT
jgi:hypothetical protein